MNPMIHEFLLQIAVVGHCGALSEIPRASAKVKLAPLEAERKKILALHLKSGGIPPASLIPSLNCSSDGVEDDQHVENPGMLPLVRDLLV
jgi:hypothetical protein